MSSIDYGVCAAISPSTVRPAQATTCTVHAPSANPSSCRISRPEHEQAAHTIPAERTSASQLAEATFREADELPCIASRMRTAKALRDLLATHRMSVTKFAALHDVNEKQAAKWLDGRANYPAWGFDVLSADMSDALYSLVRSAKPGGPNALRARISRLSHAELLDALGLITVALGKR